MEGNMPSRAANHTHRYKKKNIGQNGKRYLVYFCTKPLCSHYVPVTLAEGKMCECYICDSPFIITKAIVSGSSGEPMTRPHCLDCTKKRKAKDVEAIAAFLEGTKLTP
jgi:hypothetical protein